MLIEAGVTALWARPYSTSELPVSKTMSSPVAGSAPPDQLAAAPASLGPALAVTTEVLIVPVPPLTETASTKGRPTFAAVPVTTLVATVQVISLNSWGTVAALRALARSAAVALAPPAFPGTDTVLPLIVTLYVVAASLLPIVIVCTWATAGASPRQRMVDMGGSKGQGFRISDRGFRISDLRTVAPPPSQGGSN